MAQETTYAGKLGGLARLSAALAANSADAPHLEGPRGRLDKILGEAQEMAKQQAALKAQKQEATRRLKTLLTEGERVAEGIRRLLKEYYGLRSEKLAEFGLQPFRGRRKVNPENPDGPEIGSTTPPSPAPPGILK